MLCVTLDGLVTGQIYTSRVGCVTSNLVRWKREAKLAIAGRKGERGKG